MPETCHQYVEMMRKGELTSVETFPFYDYPNNIRYLFIEKMDIATKLWYYLCSDETSIDMPRTYIKSLQIYTDSTKIKTKDDHLGNLSLSFSAECGACQIRLLTPNGETIFFELGDLAETISAYFNRLIRKSTKMHTLMLDHKFFPFEKTNIKHLINLNYLVVNLQKHGMMDCGFTSFEQLYKIRNHLNIHYIELDLSQLIQFTAQYLTFGSVKISADTINQYMKLFVNGQYEGRTRELLLYIDANNRLQLDRLVEGLDTLKAHEDYGWQYFALVSTESPCRIGIVKYTSKFFKIEFLSEKEFRADTELFKKYGEAVEYYLWKRMSVNEE